jgi:hypothetical protein
MLMALVTEVLPRPPSSVTILEHAPETKQSTFRQLFWTAHCTSRAHPESSAQSTIRDAQALHWHC